MFMLAFSGGEVAECMSAQVQTVEMADGGLESIVSWIASGCLDPVPVQGETFVILQRLECRQVVWKCGTGDEPKIVVAGKIQAAGTVGGDKVVAEARDLSGAGHVFLEEGASAGNVFQGASDSEVEPFRVGEFRAREAMV